jgi:hypothetical protein
MRGPLYNRSMIYTKLVRTQICYVVRMSDEDNTCGCEILLKPILPGQYNEANIK